ncbi:MAG: AtpZ/AtpI family protein [Tsuneonella sp.]
MADEPENAPIGPEIGEDPKLDSLEQRIASARHTEDERIAKEHAPLRDGRSAGVQIASTMLGYPLGGIIIGLLVDNVVFHGRTLPWFTIGLMFLSFAGAMLHVVRMNKNR